MLELGQSALKNAPAIIANISVLAIFGAIVAAGVMRGLKEYRDFTKPKVEAPSTSATVAAATILENVTLNDWSRSNKLVADQLAKLIEVMLRDREIGLETRHETTALTHAMNRLHDEIEELRRDLHHGGTRRGTRRTDR